LLTHRPATVLRQPPCPGELVFALIGTFLPVPNPFQVSPFPSEVCFRMAISRPLVLMDRCLDNIPPNDGCPSFLLPPSHFFLTVFLFLFSPLSTWRSAADGFLERHRSPMINRVVPHQMRLPANVSAFPTTCGCPITETLVSSVSSRPDCQLPLLRTPSQPSASTRFRNVFLHVATHNSS